MSSPSIFGYDFIASKPAVQSDTDDISDGMAVGIHVRGTSGDVKVTYQAPDSSGAEIDDVLYLTQGDYLKIPIKRVWSTGTTATNVVVLYGKIKDKVLN